jgi:hypothetical protein
MRTLHLSLSSYSIFYYKLFTNKLGKLELTFTVLNISFFLETFSALLPKKYRGLKLRRGVFLSFFKLRVSGLDYFEYTPLSLRREVRGELNTSVPFSLTYLAGMMNMNMNMRRVT